MNGYYVADYRVHLLVKWLPSPTHSHTTPNLEKTEPPASSQIMSTNKPEFLPTSNGTTPKATAGIKGSSVF